MMSDSLEVRVGNALRNRGWTLALAESCTGGKVGDRITDVPGSSDYFIGSIVAYSYEAKERLLWGGDDPPHTPRGGGSWWRNPCGRGIGMPTSCIRRRPRWRSCCGCWRGKSERSDRGGSALRGGWEGEGPGL